MQRITDTIIIEPRTVLREGLVALLHASNFRVVSAVAAPDKIRPEVFARARMLIVGASDGAERALDCLKKVAALTQEIKIIVFKEGAGKGAQSDIMEFLGNGVDGCIFDVRSRDNLLKSLHLVLLNHRVFVIGESEALPAMSRRQESPSVSIENDQSISNDVRLSAREWQILDRIATGESNKLIARSCRLAESTVKIHLRTILRKIRVHNRTQAAIWAILNNDRHELREPGLSAMMEAGLVNSERHDLHKPGRLRAIEGGVANSRQIT